MKRAEDKQQQLRDEVDTQKKMVKDAEHLDKERQQDLDNFKPKPGSPAAEVEKKKKVRPGQKKDDVFTKGREPLSAENVVIVDNKSAAKAMEEAAPKIAAKSTSALTAASAAHSAKAQGKAPETIQANTVTVIGKAGEGPKSVSDVMKGKDQIRIPSTPVTPPAQTPRPGMPAPVTAAPIASPVQPVAPAAGAMAPGGEKRMTVDIPGPVAIKEPLGIKQPLQLVTPVLITAAGMLSVHDAQLTSTMSGLSGQLSSINGTLGGILAACQAIAAKDFAPKITVNGSTGAATTARPGASAGRERSSFSD
jgi:hypothetical protein